MFKCFGAGDRYGASMKYFLACITIAVFCCAPAAAAPCAGPAYHQFDFFVGNWTVTNKAGKTVGSDAVTKKMNDCVIFERWRDATGPGSGFGITGFQAGRHTWHQTFMDDTGLVLTLDGALENGGMHLRGTDYPTTSARLNDVLWTRHGNVVEELWRVSIDRGRTWKTVFDGFFHRR